MNTWNNKFYDIAAESDIGERDENQDAIGCSVSEDRAAIVLCDGMGGFEGGRTASNTAVNEILKLYNITDLTNENTKDFLVYAMDFADHKILGLKNENGKHIRAGTTCILLALHKRGMFCLSVGDSIMYIHRKGKLVRLTRNHTSALKAEYDYKNGFISYEEYLAYASDHTTLCSYLGLGGIELYDVNSKPYDLAANDILLIASDGLYKSLDSGKIAEIISAGKDVGAIARSLTDEAAYCARGRNQDNTSVVVCKVK